MNDASLVDFYRGWFIEIEPGQSSFRSICYSPCRQKIAIPAHFPSEFAALQAAKQEVDYQMTRFSVADVMRELYEAGRLNFQDWIALHHSLTQGF